MKNKMLIFILVGTMLFSTACVGMGKESKVEFEELAQGSYKIHNKLYVDEDKQIEINYPKLIGYENDLLEKSINKSIEDITKVYGFYSKYKNVEISYKIAEIDEDRLSIIFSGTAESDGESIIHINETLSFEL